METFKQPSNCLNIFLMFFMLALLQMNNMYAQTGWFVQNSGVTNELKSVHFENPATGWAIGNNCVLATTDGGSSWLRQSIPFNQNELYTFNCVCFVNAETGWLVGDLYVNPPGSHFMVIFKTTNSGSNWILQYNKFGAGLSSSCFQNPTTGWTVGETSILKTINGGSSWLPQQFVLGLNDTYTFKSVCFANSLTGWILADVFASPPGANFNSVIKTTNGGTNWAESFRYTDVGLTSIHFEDLLTGWAAGGGVIMITTNGGSNWRVQLNLGTENCSNYFQSIWFENPATGWVSGGSFCMPGNEYKRIIYKTTNGGMEWREQIFRGGANNFHLHSVFFVNETTGWAAGDGGVILKTTDGGVIGIEPSGGEVPNTYSLYQNRPNPFNPQTEIKFALPKESLAKLVIYDVLGRKIQVLVDQRLNPGTYEVEWDASGFSSGVYYYKLTSGDFTDVKKMILIK